MEKGKNRKGGEGEKGPGFSMNLSEDNTAETREGSMCGAVSRGEGDKILK